MSIADVLNKIVLAENEIDAIIIFDPVQGLPLYHNTKYSDDSTRNGQLLHDNYEDIAGSLNRVNSITNILTEFGDSSERGRLRYAIFQLSEGILTLYFLTIKDEPVVVAFISGTEEGVGLLLKHSKREMPTIESKLETLL
ncbi:MAG: hypothetical protein VSS75_015085 [Candidatus Parabeggiatoa sp.]|nr:hypothetical protein [Candidatus Parabeggiatoa sp.]